MADDIKRIRKALIDQGWRIEERKGGHDMAYPPDRSKPGVAMPGTPGGGRWLQNLIAQLRRSGFIWPPPKKWED
jgi:hypothetical protein